MYRELMKTASEMGLLRHRSASLRDLPSAILLPYSPKFVEWVFSEVGEESCNKYCN